VLTVMRREEHSLILRGMPVFRKAACVHLTGRNTIHTAQRHTQKDVKGNALDHTLTIRATSSWSALHGCVYHHNSGRELGKLLVY